MGTHRRALPIVMLLAVSGCTFPALSTPTPTSTPSPSPSPSASPSPSPNATSSATPDPATAVPDFSAGEVIATAIDGLRVRQRPGVSSVVVTGLLPLNAALQVIMGPIQVADLGWYLVADADPDEPQFTEGWIAAGSEPDAFLVSTGAATDDTPFIASFAQTGDAEYGPIEIGAEEDYAIRWVAVDPERVRCQFSVALAGGTADPVPAIRATIGNDVVPGILQPASFDALGVRGQAFVTIASDCAWTLVVQRMPDPASPPPSTEP